MGKMKIAIVGNLCNIGFMTLKALETQGLNPTLFISKNELNSLSDPRQEDENCFDENNIFFWEGNKTSNIVDEKLFLRHALYDIPKSNKMAIFYLSFYLKKNFDFVIGITLGSIMACFSGRPFIWLATGSDLREWVFRYKLSGIMLRFVAKKSKIIMAGSDMETILSAKRLGVEKKIEFIPFFPVNIKKIRSYKNEKNINDKILRIFNPSNQIWNIKGNDNLIKSVAILRREGYLISLTLLKRGTDYDKSKSLVIDMGMESIVSWKEVMSRKELICEMNKADVIADQFVLGDVGGIAREAMCLGKPVLGYLKNKNDIRPIINCSSVEEIKRAIIKCMDKDYRKNVGEKAACFADEYYSFNKFGQQLKRNIEKFNLWEN